MMTKKHLYDMGMICGSFDIIHAGYIRMFKDAKQNVCRKLTVALQTDPTIDRPEKNPCVQDIQDRIEIMSAIKYIDHLVVYDTEVSLLACLEATPYDVRILGTDYIGKDWTGKEIDPAVYYHQRNHDISTSDIKRKIYETTNRSTRYTSAKDDWS